MNCIGRVNIDASTWVSPENFAQLDRPRPELFIADPYERENVNAAMWEHIGWIFPGDAANDGGKIYKNREGMNSVAAYIKRETTPQPEPRNEIDEMKLVIGNMSRRIDRLEKLATTDQNLTTKAKEAFFKGRDAR